MAFLRNVKRPIGILVSHANLNSHVDGFSIATVSQPTSIAASQGFLFGSLARRFSSQAPSSTEQMNLIKQLRERTSAPIKDVKAALVECDWDIGMNDSFFSFLHSFSFSKILEFSVLTECRGCAEGFEEKREGSGHEKVVKSCN